MTDLPPELPNGTYALLTWRGDSGTEHRDVVVREDVYCDADDPHRWYIAAWDRWLDWAGLHAEGAVEELVPRSEVDRLVAQAVADGGYEDIGFCRIAVGAGRCIRHGEVYTPVELDRLRQRVAEEDSRGDRPA